MNRLDLKLHRNKFLSAPLVGYPASSLNNSTARENLTDSKIQTDTLLKYHNILQPDFLFPFMDLTVEAEALGLEVYMNENDPPEISTHPIKTESDLKTLSIPDISSAARFHVYLETILNLHENSPALISGYVTSPFTLAGLLTGAEKIAAEIIIKPDFIHKLLNFTTEVSLNYAIQQQKAGADCLVLLEPTASLLSPDLFEKFVTPHINKIATNLDIPVILHVCGDTTPLINVFTQTKMDGLSLDYGVDLEEIMPQIPDKVLVMGNIDPVRTILNGDPQSIYRQTMNLINELKGYDNFIPATGCDVPPQTKFENIKAFQEAVNAANRKYKNININTI